MESVPHEYSELLKRLRGPHDRDHGWDDACDREEACQAIEKLLKELGR